MKISDCFYVMVLLTVHAIFHGMCTSLIYGSTDIPCDDDNCRSILPPLTSVSTSQKTTSADSQDSTPHPNSNESLNQSEQNIFFHKNTSITLACPRLANYKRATGKYRWTKIKPNVEIVVLSEGSAPLRRTHLKLTENETHYVITIRNAKSSDEGSYQCTIGDSIIIIQTVHVFLIVKPFVTNIEPYSKKHLHSSKPNVRLFTLNAAMVLSCWVEGVPPPMVTWYRADGSPLPDGSELVTETVVSTFVIANLTLEHAGKYVCFANNSLGQTTEKEIEVIVQFRPTAVALKQVLRKSLNDEYVTLTCTVNAIPNATLKWLKDGSALDTSKDKKQVRFPVYCADDGLMKFVLKSVKPRDYGNYTCLATNRIGQGRASILLSAKPVAPIITSYPFGTMMYEYSLKWQVNSTFRLPPVTVFKIEYRLLDIDNLDQDFNESDTEWKYIEHSPRKEDPQENVTFNVTLQNLRKNSTYFVMIEAMNSIKPPERGDAAFFQFQTSAEFIPPRSTTTVSTKGSSTVTLVKSTLTKTTTPGAITSNEIWTSLQKNPRKASTLHAPTNPGLVRMTAAMAGNPNRAGHAVALPSAAVIAGVVICKLILL